MGGCTVGVEAQCVLCCMVHTCKSVQHIFTVTFDSLFLAPTQPNKNTYMCTSPTCLCCLVPVVSHLPSWSIHTYRQTHLLTYTQVTNSNKAQSSFPVCVHRLSDIWSVPWGFQHIHSTPAKRPVTGPSSLLQVASLELTCYLSASCAWSFPQTAQGAPSVELHTHKHTCQSRQAVK